MTHCSTWHVRIDLVDDGTVVTARAQLIGAPMAMTAHAGEPHDKCVSGSNDVDPLSRWRAVEDLVPALVDALSTEHRAHAVHDPSREPAARPHRCASSTSSSRDLAIDVASTSRSGAVL
jgi:hypothetical protein